MREIKFRVWQIVKRQMLYEPEASRDYGDYINHKAKALVIMQFTGMIDANGKEIYEGDIVKRLKSNRTMEVKWTIQEVHIGWNMGASRSVVTPGSHLEVLGNIYEKSPLLTNVL